MDRILPLQTKLVCDFIELEFAAVSENNRISFFRTFQRPEGAFVISTGVNF